ncbi:rolling circle replication-associated protein [Sporosarcina sp. FSL K6-1508]|uniref:rolling circle replication-associated protein n=1 Tax=Sporosarcina sp. FSL K6-1508 TaxID=2921553 RepID=UPI0030F643A7
MKYVRENYEELFAMVKKEYEDSQEECIEKLRDVQLAGYRVKTIKSGPMLEVEAYPFWNIPRGQRKKIGNESSTAQQNLNDKNTKKHVIRLIHANFTEDDIKADFTYTNDRLPADPEQAKKDMTNLIRRMKRSLKKQKKYKDFELKYIYVTEHSSDEKKGKVRVHHHMITNFPDRDALEELWNGGGRTQTRRLQQDDYGFEGLARYILKDKRDNPAKRYTVSRNLKKPTVTIADSKLTRRRAGKIATEEVSAQETFEKMYKGYKFNDIQVKFSEFVSGAYLYVRMKHLDGFTRKRRRVSDDEDNQHY